MQPIIIKNKLIASYPPLTDYLLHLSPIEKLKPKSITVLDAVSEIIIGQMLSRKAADTIIQRAKSHAIKRGSSQIALLSVEEMRTCGISGSKAKAIKLFAEQYFNDISRYENWRILESAKLFAEVDKHWGLSHWSASMLAIFYFGFEDVYPVGDSSIRRAIRLLEQKGITLEPERAVPYRSYLALYLWKMLDMELVQ